LFEFSKYAILLYVYLKNNGAYILSDIPNFLNYFININIKIYKYKYKIIKLFYIVVLTFTVCLTRAYTAKLENHLGGIKKKYTHTT